jgi:uncharacterized protein YecT (DUF1311 family)
MSSYESSSLSRFGSCLRGFCALLLGATTLPALAELPADCNFADLELPADFAVLAAGEYSGRPLRIQIDQSGHRATQMNVAVNSPSKPVVLILRAYEPTIWSIKWSRNTRILAVVTGGYHRQAVAGLPRSVPLMVRSYDDSSPCGHFYVRGDGNDVSALDPLSRQLFGRAVNGVYLAKNGLITAGDPLPAGEALETSSDTLPESFVDKSAPRAGLDGLRDAVKKGLIRRAASRDVDDWVNAIRADMWAAGNPPVSGQAKPRVVRPTLHNAYVILKPFTYPAGLYGGNHAVFFIPTGVPRPLGNHGHSAVYDFNALGCHGPPCELARNSAAVLCDARIKSGAPCSRADYEESYLAGELKRTDDEINAVYRRVMTGVEAGDRKNLRNQQRAWIKSRKAKCALNTKLSNRKKWIAYVLADNARASCLVRMTKERLAQLSELEKARAGNEIPAEPRKIETTDKPSISNLDYMLASTEARANGKWYFEVQIDHGKIREELGTTFFIFIGIQGEGTGAGMGYDIHPQDLALEMGKGDSAGIVGDLRDGIRLSKVTVGIAADLDNDKFYFRRAGKWITGLPGGAGGIDLQFGRHYKPSITATVPLANLVEQNIVMVNLGDRTFADVMPDGYAAFNSSNNAASARAGVVETLAPGDR